MLHVNRTSERRSDEPLRKLLTVRSRDRSALISHVQLSLVKKHLSYSVLYHYLNQADV